MILEGERIILPDKTNLNWKLCPNCKRAVVFDENECPYCSQHVPENSGSLKQEDDRPVLIKAFESRRQQHKDYELKSPKVVDENYRINTKILSIRKIPRAIDEINRINAKILSFCEKTVASSDHCSDSISNPYLGVFRKTRFDNIEILRRFCKTTSRKLKMARKEFSLFKTNAFLAMPLESLDFPIVKQYKEFLTNFIEFMDKWGKSLKLGYYLNESQVLRLAQDFSTSMMGMNKKFTLLFKQYQASLSPHKEPLNNICPSCNRAFNADAVFCKFCGAQLQGKTRFIPKKVKKEVLARDNWQCVMCGKKEDLQFDHIIPYSKGGSNTSENLQILCASCNKKKYTNIV